MKNREWREGEKKEVRNDGERARRKEGRSAEEKFNKQ